MLAIHAELNATSSGSARELASRLREHRGRWATARGHSATAPRKAQMLRDAGETISEFAQRSA